MFTPPSLLQSLTQPKALLPYPYNTGMDFKYGTAFTNNISNNYGLIDKPIGQINTNQNVNVAQMNTNPVVNSYSNYNNIN